MTIVGSAASVMGYHHPGFAWGTWRRGLARSVGAGGFSTPQTAEQHVEREHQTGDGDQEGADRGDDRLELEMEAVPDPHGQGLRSDAREEQRDDQLVERGEEGEQRRRHDAGKRQRDHDAPEDVDAAAAKAEAGAFEID